MTTFEVGYLAAEPFLPPLYSKVRKQLLAFVRGAPEPLDILDVGGRKSHYTIGVPARILISELARKAQVQEKLHLGLTGSIAEQVLKRRTNVKNIVFDDMTESKLESVSFDCVVAVEVLEHVKRDDDFVKEVSRVLRPQGYFVMTTPNGDAVENTNPDHQRHYTRDQLHTLLSKYFADISVECAVAGGRFHDWGLNSWSLRRPLHTSKSMVGNLINSWQSSRTAVKDSRRTAQHLFAVAKKSSLERAQ